MFAQNAPSYSALRFAPEDPLPIHDFQTQRQRDAAEILGDIDISPPILGKNELSESSVDGSNLNNF